MKEGKRKPTAKKNNMSSKSAASKKVVPKNQTPKMPEKRTEPPKVKKVDVEEINKDFEDVENEDKRLIVFIAIAILVIVGTVIGLLVGCEKKEEKEPEKPVDVVVPEKPEEKDDKDDEGVETREVVRKVRATYRPKKPSKVKDDENKEDVEEKVTYNVTFYLGEETNVEEVEEGNKSTAYVPKGYSTCTYYTDSELTTEYDIESLVTENVNVYMSCNVINYTVDYGQDIVTDNPVTYTVEDEETVLNNPETDLYFNGWYTDIEFTNQVLSLNKDLVEFADEENVIHLYAYITEEELVQPVDPVDPTDPVTPGEEETPVEGGDPTDPVTPGEEETPVEEENPTDPVTPGEEETLVEEEEPTEVVTPNEDETPVEEEVPTEVVTPSEEETPVEEEVPTEVVTPSEEETPVEQENPIENTLEEL